VEKFGRARQATDDNIIEHTRFACWITMATDTHTESKILLFFYGNNSHENAPQYYVSTHIVWVFMQCTQL